MHLILNFLGFETIESISSVGVVDGHEDIEAGMVNRLVANQYLNTIANVVSAANLAYDLNYTNSNSYLNGYVERENSVEVYVSMGDHPPAGCKKYYLMEPDSRTKAKYLYGFDDITSGNTRTKRIEFFNNLSDEDVNASGVPFYNLLKKLNDTKLVIDNGQRYTIYKYYFKGTCYMNEETGMLDSVVFTLIEDPDFDDM